MIIGSETEWYRWSWWNESGSWSRNKSIECWGEWCWIEYWMFEKNSHFAECYENRPVNVWEVLINLLKSPNLQWWWKWKSDLKSMSGTGSPPEVNHFFWFAVILHADRMTNKPTVLVEVKNSSVPQEKVSPTAGLVWVLLEDVFDMLRSLSSAC